MAKKFICGGEKYCLAGQAGNSICLPVSLLDLPEKIEVEGHTLALRNDFHITLVAVGKVIEKHQVTIPDFLEKIVADFCEFVQKNPVDLLRFRDEFRFVSQNERRTVVVMCDVVNIDQFFDLLNVRYNLKLQHPPTHVTLYTLQPDVGIFMTDSDDMTHLSKVIPSPIRL